MIYEQLYRAVGAPSLIDIGLLLFLVLALSKRAGYVKGLWMARFKTGKEMIETRLKH
jgi:hypothetical protein